MAGEVDSPESMVGDVNLFLSEWEDDEDADGEGTDTSDGGEQPKKIVGEVDIMIANSDSRGKGFGKLAVRVFLLYVEKHLDKVLNEYKTGAESNQILEFGGFIVRIKASNEASIALFRGLGFERKGEANYFGEILMTMPFGKVQSIPADEQIFREALYE